jgi:hypothetical protein
MITSPFNGLDSRVKVEEAPASRQDAGGISTRIQDIKR